MENFSKFAYTFHVEFLKMLSYNSKCMFNRSKTDACLFFIFQKGMVFHE